MGYLQVISDGVDHGLLSMSQMVAGLGSQVMNLVLFAVVISVSVGVGVPDTGIIAITALRGLLLFVGISLNAFEWEEHAVKTLSISFHRGIMMMVAWFVVFGAVLYAFDFTGETLAVACLFVSSSLGFRYFVRDWLESK